MKGPQHRHFPLWLRYAIDAAIIVLAIFVALSGAVYWMARRSAPVLDGSMQLAGLHSPVRLVRDELGVVHIYARDDHDALMAQGYAMAQDRLFQMDLLRRVGEGKLSEVFGPATLRLDRGTRLLGLNRVAETEAQRLSPADRETMQDFALGVNQYILSRGTRLPLEFLLARYRPALWTPADSLAIVAQMYRELTTSYHDELEYERFVAIAGPELARRMFPDRSPMDVLPGQLPSVPAENVMRFPIDPDGVRFALAEPQPASAPALDPMPARDGSNNWVLAPDRTTTGRPILANDPHLGYQVPGIWWAVDMATPQGHVAGVALAGLPGVTIGHNDRIAWGVTNVGADVQDLYREKLHGDMVVMPDGLVPIKHIIERIRVKGRPDDVVNVALTPHGPIIGHDSGDPLALRWALYEPGSLGEFSTFIGLARARNWNEFEAALANFRGPALNWVYADADGNIGYQCAARIPIRSPGLDGMLPLDGSKAETQWQGWIPFEDLPRVYNPASGLIATANGRIAPNDYRYVITRHWDAPYRTLRIVDLLLSKPRWSPAEMAQIQMDVESEFDRFFAQQMLRAAANDPAAVRSGAMRIALEDFLRFDGRMLHDRVAPTLLVETRDELLLRLLSARVGAPLAHDYRWSEAPVLLEQLLVTRPAVWLPRDFDRKGWDALLLDCLAAVTSSKTVSPRLSRWGRVMMLHVENPVLTHVPLLRNFSDLGPVEMNGSGLTVKQTHPDFGPSMRFVADFSNWDRSTLTLFSGESGQVLDPHYRDQFPAYLRGTPEPFWYSAAAVEAHRRHAMTLHP
jgi:penicillin amidase